jgi:hypothetical protein
MSVTRLPKDPGPAAWNAILPEESARPSLETRMTADWLVIGAGRRLGGCRSCIPGTVSRSWRRGGSRKGPRGAIPAS